MTHAPILSRLWRCAGVAGGSPCLKTTGVMAVVIARRFVAGETVPQLAAVYGVPVESIEDALRLVIYAKGASLESQSAWTRIARVVPETFRARPRR
jgi:uncharacterized protein (DUF433 family)